jgi:hypothetical protein
MKIWVFNCFCLLQNDRRKVKINIPSLWLYKSVPNGTHWKVLCILSILSSKPLRNKCDVLCSMGTNDFPLFNQKSKDEIYLILRSTTQTLSKCVCVCVCVCVWYISYVSADMKFFSKSSHQGWSLEKQSWRTNCKSS